MGKMSTCQVYAPAVKHQIQVPCTVDVFLDGGIYWVLDWGGGVLVGGNADYTTAVNMAIVYVGGLGGGTVHLHPNRTAPHRHVVTTPIVDGGQDYITLEGEGFNTILYLQNAANCRVVVVTGRTGWLIRDLLVDGNAAGQTAVNTAFSGINFVTCTDCIVSQCRVQNTYLNGTITLAERPYGVFFYNSCTYCGVYECRFENCYYGGIGFYGTGGTSSNPTNPCLNCMAIGNFVHETSHCGLQSAYSWDVLWANNIIIDACEGIVTHHNRHALVVGNKCLRDDGTLNEGIHVIETRYYVDVLGAEKKYRGRSMETT